MPTVPLQVLLFAMVTLGPLLGCGAEPALQERSPPAQEGASEPAPIQEPASGALGPRTNVIIVSIDTLRADRLGSYGYDRPTSPAIDALAARGIRFAHAAAESPWTLPSHMTLMTGLFPSAHGATAFGRQLPDGIPTLAEILHRQGYRTFGYTTGGFVGSPYGFARGFETYSEKLESFFTLVGRAAARISELGPEERYFLFLQTFEVHCPYQARERWVQQFERTAPEHHLDTRGKCRRHYVKMDLSPGQMDFLSDMYDAGVRQADASLQRLAVFLEERDAWRDTLFILLSDHGDEFGEHGSLGHGRSLHGEVMRVPLIFVAPGFGARVIEERVGLVDVMPTVLDLLEITPPATMHGRSLVPWMAGRPDGGKAGVAQFGEATTGGVELRSIVAGGFKLIVDQKDGETRLFDLARDARELEDVSADHPERVKALQRELDAHFSSLPSTGGLQAHPTEQNLEQLRALGYIGDGPDRAEH